MHIIHLASELAPIAKVGGLGDVTSGLSKALIREGAYVEVILPFYNTIEPQTLTALQQDITFATEIDERSIQVTVWSAHSGTLPIKLIACNADFFQRNTIYGEADDPLRFMAFTKMALDYLLHKKLSPNILNIHDWITALAAPLYDEIYKDLGVHIDTVVMTLHNMAYQGHSKTHTLSKVVPLPAARTIQHHLQDDHRPHHINLLKGGLLYAKRLTTVSPSYAEAIQGERGHGLGPLLRQKGTHFKGILNGIDTEYWNPVTDPLLVEKFPKNLQDIQQVRHAKTINKRALRTQLNLRESVAPLFCAITRLVKQKGPELIHAGIDYILQRGGQCVLIGSIAEEDVEQEFQNLANTYHNCPDVHFHFAFNEPLAHQVYASSDCLIMPSQFEPCGLAQMIAMRYGTLPIVTQVDGLKDTVFDSAQNGISISQANGYTFSPTTQYALQSTLDRVLHTFYHDHPLWERLMLNGLNHDWSWKQSAQTYLDFCQKT